MLDLAHLALVVCPLALAFGPLALVFGTLPLVFGPLALVVGPDSAAWSLIDWPLALRLRPLTLRLGR